MTASRPSDHVSGGRRAEMPESWISALTSVGLGPVEQRSLAARMPSGTLGILLYGSRARGDALPESDFDLLRLAVHAYPTFTVGKVSVSSYTAEQLRSASGTLFGTHLIRDGQILLDSDGELSSILAQIQPAQASNLIETVRGYSVVLDQSDTEVEAHIGGLVRLARYLLRTAVYAKAMAQGRPCFSVRELADRFQDPSLAILLASDPDVTGEPSIQLFEDLVSRLRDLIGDVPSNKFGSLASLAVAMWESDRNLAALAVRAASEDEDTLDYSDLPKVLL